MHALHACMQTWMWNKGRGGKHLKHRPMQELHHQEPCWYQWFHDRSTVNFSDPGYLFIRWSQFNQSMNIINCRSHIIHIGEFAQGWQPADFSSGSATRLLWMVSTPISIPSWRLSWVKECQFQISLLDTMALHHARYTTYYDTHGMNINLFILPSPYARRMRWGTWVSTGTPTVVYRLRGGPKWWKLHPLYYCAFMRWHGCTSMDWQIVDTYYIYIIILFILIDFIYNNQNIVYKIYIYIYHQSIIYIYI